MAIAVALGCLGAAFFRTQIVRNSEFVLRADDNRFRVVPIPAPRGTIFDRNGKVVAETVTGYSLSIEPGPRDSVRARLEPLRQVLGLDSAAVEEVMARAGKRSIHPVLVSDALTFGQVSKLEERRGRISGIVLEPHPIRRYPYGDAVAHVVGYVGEINDRELESPAWTGFRSGQHIGKGGVERQYERRLGGTQGARYVEVDARGKVVGRFASQLTTPPKAGADVRLTLDLDLQRYARAIFPANMRGAIVAMVPGTGEVLAMYSNPSYDPNLLTGRIDPQVWRGLNAGDSRPLLNRAMVGIYPPGSTWKLATAIIGLNRGVITPEKSVMPLACTGGMTFAGRYSRCDKRDGHGSLNLVNAIAASCNVYFYQLGILLGIETLTGEGTRLGFARKTGMDLPGERAGSFPSGREWYVHHFGWRPPPSEVMNLSIGQGPNSQTPLRMAQFFSALAANGTARAPHVVMGAPAPLETDLHVSGPTLATVREGMARVVEDGGTAAAVALDNWTLYGKTGTAQNAQDADHPHAWFTGFASPHGGQPEVVVAAVVEFGGHGSQSAAPLAARVANYYMNKKHGLANPAIEDVKPMVIGGPAN
jgi:penicillin-binding protein 2